MELISSFIDPFLMVIHSRSSHIVIQQVMKIETHQFNLQVGLGKNLQNFAETCRNLHNLA